MKYSRHLLLSLVVVVFLVSSFLLFSRYLKNIIREQVIAVLSEEQIRHEQDVQEAESELLNGNPFYVHIVQVGGNFSSLYSLEAYGLEDGIGQYYINPPEDYVSIGSTRGGDSLVIRPSDLSRSAGYSIDEASCNEGGDICHFSIPDMRNEIEVKFIRK